MDEEVDKTLRQYSSAKEAQKNVDLNRLKDYIKEAIFNEKTMAFLENIPKSAKEL